MPLFSNERDTFFKAKVSQRGIKKVILDLVFDPDGLDMDLLERTLERVDDPGKGEGVNRLAELMGEETVDWTSLIAAANCPVLLVGGRSDPLLDEEAMKDIAASTSSELFLIERCGHFPHIERVDEVARMIREFVG